ncbi:acyltransferase [Riemerella anatipestifer]|uniref:acyltransferase n=1 Tax=Riemerella anatipestifer TaxID=34085 RepID=UPI0030C4EC57
MIARVLKNIYYSYRLKKKIKKIQNIGDNNDLSKDIIIYYPERVSIGSNIYIGPNAEINGLGEVEIRSGVIIGPNLVIHSANHNYKDAKYLPYDETFVFKKVVINENVWIGGNVIITPGSIIGEGCIIGAGCVVSGNIPPLSIVVGNPCRVIKSRDKEHYYRLKEQGYIYLKYKKEKKLQPKINKI